jgi:sterol desaturase/sphingolipid hydroxylase (fatty acid hydroxylase superfamily)
VLAAVFRHTFVPLLLLLSGLAWSVRDAGSRALLGLPIDWATVVLFASLFVLWLAEQVQPMDRRWNHGSFPRDLVYLFVISLISSAAIGLTTRWLGAVVPAFAWWPATWPLAVKVALAFFVVELGSYVMHRLAHRVPFFWRFHQTHHVITGMTALKALRTHPVDNLFFTVLRSVPLLVLGAGAAEVSLAGAFGLSLSLLAHANLDVVPGPLGLVINFPRYHAVHHSAALDESNSNFGCHTVVFDRLLGTFRSAARAGLEIGVTPVGPRTLWQELVGPFLPSVD